MAKIHDLPVELLPNIAYFVLHKRTLAHATLVCKAWKMPFQVYLFERTNFNFNSHERLQLLYSTDPDTNPCRDILLNSIRSVRFWNGRSGDWANHSCVAYEHEIIHMKFLPIIQSLNLTSICLSHAPFDWESLSLEDTYAIIDLFRRPTLCEVMVDAVMQPAYFPLVILPLCPNIKYFGLRYEEFPHNDQVFSKFNNKVAKLIEVYKNLIKEKEKGGNVNAVTEDPELRKLALGPVGAVLLRGLTLSAMAIPIFVGFADVIGNDVTLVYGSRLTLDLLERYNPPTVPTNPPGSQGLPLEATIWFRAFHDWGANLTELRLHLTRHCDVTEGAYPTRNALKNLVNLNHLDLAVDIQDARDRDTEIIAKQIQIWFINFLKCLAAPRELVHVGIIYRVLVFILADCGVPDLVGLTDPWGELDQVLSSECSSIKDLVVILSLGKSGKENRNVWEDFEHGVEEQNSGSITALFQETHRRCRKFKAIAMADPEYREYIKGLLD